jgi:hypothetical protein
MLSCVETRTGHGIAVRWPSGGRTTVAEVPLQGIKSPSTLALHSEHLLKPLSRAPPRTTARPDSALQNRQSINTKPCSVDQARTCASSAESGPAAPVALAAPPPAPVVRRSGFFFLSGSVPGGGAWAGRTERWTIIEGEGVRSAAEGCVGTLRSMCKLFGQRMDRRE